MQLIGVQTSCLCIFILSMSHLLGSDLPIGETYCGQPCYRLAILFHWSASHTNKWTEEEEENRWLLTTVTRLKGKGFDDNSHNVRPRRRRTISSSLELEIKMLSITDMFAILPCPWSPLGTPWKTKGGHSVLHFASVEEYNLIFLSFWHDSEQLCIKKCKQDIWIFDCCDTVIFYKKCQ